ncbi:MAG TPA: hypothetical protein VMR41_02675 [Patescibacteria group bacterium]|nr:hypothetical protein [Patescibacteria group bacterium]
MSVKAAIDSHTSPALLAASTAAYVGTQIGVSEFNRKLLNKRNECPNLVAKLSFDGIRKIFNGNSIIDKAMQAIAVYAGTESTMIPIHVAEAKLTFSGSVVEESAAIGAYFIGLIYNAGLLFAQSRELNAKEKPEDK